MTSQGPYLPCDSGTNTFKAQLSPLVKILWPLSVMVLCSLWQLLFTGTQCLRKKTSHGDPRMALASARASSNHWPEPPVLELGAKRTRSQGGVGAVVSSGV